MILKNLSSKEPNDEHATIPLTYIQRFYQRYNVIISLLTPTIIVYSIWVYFMVSNSKFYLYTTSTISSTNGYSGTGWFIATMVFVASIIHGITSGGGSAMSIPMLSYFLNIPISISIELSFMIQAIGLAATACSMLYMKVTIEKSIVIYSGIGSVLGVICGLSE